MLAFVGKISDNIRTLKPHEGNVGHMSEIVGNVGTDIHASFVFFGQNLS